MFWSRTTSIRRNTKAAPNPIPAAPAIPSMVRARVQIPGRSVTGARPTSSRIARTAVSSGPDRKRDAKENKQDGQRLEEPEQHRPAHDGGDVGHVVIAVQLGRGIHPVSG